MELTWQGTINKSQLTFGGCVPHALLKHFSYRVPQWGRVAFGGQFFVVQDVWHIARFNISVSCTLLSVAPFLMPHPRHWNAPKYPLIVKNAPLRCVFWPCPSFIKLVLLLIPILQVVKLRHRDVQQLLQGHTVEVMDLIPGAWLRGLCSSLTCHTTSKTSTETGNSRQGGMLC